ncbi:RNA polymerase sigma factor [Clostridium saccharoperbutylacetonicum]|jgi:RNA polymerase sigma factor|uniref:RNA polymerase sigma factor SigI n=1 Tax=Clostridium saccharoperbutylacetonicum N1-4(HMT) TaxID=931276 RepID=M1MLI7_9CLOT|nr:RNA polymerase sigma factor SigI [Clostridium saccharoperbutylacetonicum]AGF57113.1 RNA polymerase sigma factor SigI [Clostridium saccharoperbutylacetonicum N1-4(HMT)]NRT62128.1 RNA polymerase sigma factor [Clostridium saccharoperbutylacetonicum]NSB25458.1 RNA polymerase sigma factor [Clostridium saccharoperbutylacetonicum]NSB44828.1 RNA polymerase sigma factor [Clostridium saccharoperbutylacetonicum]
MLECVLIDLNVDKNTSINELIENHMPFIIKSISEVTGRYVSCENDEELSVGLLGFHEAIERYDNEKGHFLSYAKLVIGSRIKNYLKSENKHQHSSLDDLLDKGVDIKDEYFEPKEDNSLLLEQINKLKTEIGSFGFTFEDLVNEAPKQQATRKNAIMLAEQISVEEEFTSFMYLKKRLPITRIVAKFSVTEKVIKRSKKFIISVVIIIDKNLNALKNWIRK